MTKDFRVLKSGTCPSLSGRSKLTYEFAVGPSNELHVRIAKNSGGGFFHDGWVQWERVQAVLDKSGNKPLICHTLEPLFKGLSVNTPGFLLAALKHEGLVVDHAEVARCYQRADPAPFFQQMKALLSGPAKPAKAVKAVKVVKAPAQPPAKLPAKPPAKTPPKRTARSVAPSAAPKKT